MGGMSEAKVFDGYLQRSVLTSSFGLDLADFGFDGAVAEEEGEAVAGSEGGGAVGAVAVFEGDQEAAVEGAAGVGGFDAALQQVEGVQGVGVPVEHGVYQSDFECFKSTELRCGVGADGQMEPLDEGVEPPGFAGEAVEEPVGERGGRFDVGVCHHVHYVEIVVVADARQDGKRELRHVDREFVMGFQTGILRKAKKRPAVRTRVKVRK